ncbi:MAG: hypothetical protein Q8P93_04715 [bacterium]|nr:hypothetical protein [bacterium]
MITTQTQLQKRIMRRIYVVHTLRFILQPMIIKPAIVLVLLLQMSRTVSLAHVFQNMMGNMDGLPLFVSSAVSNAEITTLVLSAGIIITLIWFARDMAVRRLNVS